jgi:hypothetical protein
VDRSATSGAAGGAAPPSRARSWPLIVLAAASFVPFLGIFFGAAAVTWGLLSERPRARLAIILGGSGAFLQMAGGLALALFLQTAPSMRQYQAQSTAQDLERLVTALDAYRASTGHYPATLHVLVGRPLPAGLVNIYDQTRGPFRVRPYQYRRAPDGRSFDLFSAGPDGIPGTPDDIRPVLSDSVLRHTGYLPPP